MPLNEKGQKIMRSMRQTYPTEKKAKEVFYATKNAGKITSVEKKKKKSETVRHRGKTFRIRQNR